MSETKLNFFLRRWSDKTTAELEDHVRREDRRTARYRAAALLLMERPEADLRVFCELEREPVFRGRRGRYDSRREWWGTLRAFRRYPPEELAKIAGSFPRRSIMARAALFLLRARVATN
ncbi:MAG: hypothetical protein KA419_07155 [Acidobacteria bacterium]|nr:hypothetical protein [Acidobacteriota bacterium]